MAEPDSVYARALLRAADIVGGPKVLAQRLQVTPFIMERWMDGLARPPLAYFFRAVDIIIEEKLRAETTCKREPEDDVNRPPH